MTMPKNRNMKTSAGKEDDRVEGAVVAEVHEVEQHQCALDGRHTECNPEVQTSEIDGGNGNGDIGQHQQGNKNHCQDRQWDNMPRTCMVIVMVSIRYVRYAVFHGLIPKEE